MIRFEQSKDRQRGRDIRTKADPSFGSCLALNGLPQRSLHTYIYMYIHSSPYLLSESDMHLKLVGTKLYEVEVSKDFAGSVRL